MRVGLAVVAIILLGPAACGAEPAPSAEQEEAGPSGRLMKPEKVADHVWVMRQPDRIWSAVIGNAVIVEQSNGVVLLDSGGTIADGHEIVEAVSKLTPKPIKAVVLSHWHNDHPLGVPAIVERYPQARIIATTTTVKLMADPDVLNTGIGKPDPAREKSRLEGAERRSADYRTRSQDPSLSPAVRREYAIEAAWVMERARRQAGNYVVLPTETFSDRLLIDDPLSPVELLHLGQANTKGDAFVWLPRQKVIATGDAVVLPTPYGFSNAIAPWLATLDRLESYDFRTLIPGHGKVQRDRSYLSTLRWSMNDVRRQAQALAATAKTPEEALARFDRTEQRRRFAANDAWSQRWLDEYWLNGMAETAFKEAKGIPLEQSVD